MSAIDTTEELRDLALEQFEPLLTEDSFSPEERSTFARALKRVLHWTRELQDAKDEPAKAKAREQRGVCLDTLAQGGLLRLARADGGGFALALGRFTDKAAELATPIATAVAQAAAQALIEKIRK